MLGYSVCHCYMYKKSLRDFDLESSDEKVEDEIENLMMLKKSTVKKLCIDVNALT